MLQTIANDIHAILWTHFRQPETGLLYTFIDPYEVGRINLPAPDEIDRDIPNSNGWTTPIEDCNLVASALLPAMLQRYEVTRAPEHAQQARQLYAGLMHLWRISASPGFVPRGVLPDGTTHYRDVSVDHMSFWIMTVWHYYRSPLASPRERAEMRRAVAGVVLAAEMQGWRLCREDGRLTAWGHLLGKDSVPRAKVVLLMLLAVAHDITEDDHWHRQYLHFRDGCEHTRLDSWQRSELSGEVAWVSAQAAELLDTLLDLEVEESAARIYRTELEAIARGSAAQMAACRDYEPERAWQDCRFRTRTFVAVLRGLGGLSRCPDPGILAEHQPLAEAAIGHYDLRRDAKCAADLVGIVRYYWTLAARGLIPYRPELEAEGDPTITGIPDGVPYQSHHIPWYDALSRTYSGLPQRPEHPESQHCFVG